MLLLLLAACRPGIPGGTVEAAATDLNIFFVVDTSSSIAAEDHAPAGGQAAKGQASEGQAAQGQAAGVPRLDGVREDIRAIARELGGARYSLISFDSSAAVRMPLTTDTSALETAVAVLGPEVTDYSRAAASPRPGRSSPNGSPPPGTATRSDPGLVFYLGDGEQTSDTAPQALGIEGSLVSGGAVLGYGTRDGGRMKENSGDPTRPAATYIQDPTTGAAAVSRLDEDRLRDLARQLAVPYLHRAAGDAAAPMLQQATPGTLVRTGEGIDGRTELYWAPAFAAFLLALRETLLVSGQLRELRPARRSGRRGQRARHRGEWGGEGDRPPDVRGGGAVRRPGAGGMSVRRRRRLLLWSALPVLLALLLAAKLLSASWFAGQASSAFARGDGPAVESAAVVLGVANFLEPHKAPFAAGDALALRGDYAGARAAFEAALAAAPAADECRVRANLALSIERLADAEADGGDGAETALPPLTALTALTAVAALPARPAVPTASGCWRRPWP